MEITSDNINYKLFDLMKTSDSQQLFAYACKYFSLNPLSITDNTERFNLIVMLKAAIDYEPRYKARAGGMK